jgi:hypothetical protein
VGIVKEAMELTSVPMLKMLIKAHKKPDDRKGEYPHNEACRSGDAFCGNIPVNCWIPCLESRILSMRMMESISQDLLSSNTNAILEREDLSAGGWHDKTERGRSRRKQEMQVERVDTLITKVC